MYPNTKYNDPTNRDWRPPARVSTDWPVIDSNHSATGTVRVGCAHHNSRIALHSCALAVARSAEPLMRSILQSKVAADPLPEPEEKQIANSL